MKKILYRLEGVSKFQKIMQYVEESYVFELDKIIIIEYREYTININLCEFFSLNVSIKDRLNCNKLEP